MYEDVYLRYRLISGECELRHPGLFTSVDMYGGHDTMVDTMLVHCVGVSIDVATDINKFRGVDSYYVRRSISCPVFFNLHSVGGIKNDILMAYNVDPWGRQFPFFVNGITSDYYDNCGEKKRRYGYWVFYHNRVIDTVLLLNNVVSQMILTVTSLDGVSVGCLDLIEG